MPTRCRAIFDKIAVQFDRLRPPESKVLQTLKLCCERSSSNQTLLDLGCGTGRYSIPLSVAFKFNLVGLDHSFGMIRVARSRWPEGRWICADIHKSPLLKQGVDIALSAYVLQFLDWRVALKALRYHLRRGAKVFILTYEPTIFATALYHKYIPKLRRIDEERFPAVSSIRSALLKLGIETSEVTIPCSVVVESEDDIAFALMRLRAKYCSTAHLVDDDELVADSIRLESALRSSLRHGPLVFRHDTTLVVGRVRGS